MVTHRARRQLRSISSVLAVVVLGSVPRWAAAQLLAPWWQTSIDRSADVGYFTSLALDGRDRAHIAYADFSHASLRYARQTAAGWDTVTVDRFPAQHGWHSSIALALDPAGEPRVAYQDEDRGDLRYAWHTDSGWHTEVVDREGVVGAYASLAVDTQGAAHIAYFDEDQRALRYAWQDGGHWRTEVADSTGDLAHRLVGQYTAIATDASGDPHIAYYDAAQGDLKYAVRRAGAWQVQTLDVAGDVGRYCALALDREGRAAIAYTDFANLSTRPALTATFAHGKHVKYGHETPAGWYVDIADASGKGAQYVSLALDGQGLEHLVYYDFFQLILKYSIESVDGWNLTSPGLPILAGDFPSIALDRSEAPSVSYLDVTGERGELAFLSQGLHVVEPSAGTRWPLNDSATVRWKGVGPVRIDYSPDDGVTWNPLTLAATGNSARIATPAVATPRARLRLQRAAPFAQAETDTTFIVGSGTTPPLRVVSGTTPTGNGVPRLLFTADAPLSAGARATWRVYDVRGRCVHTGTTPPLRAGVTESLLWDGRDPAGRAVGRGTYLVRVSWDGRAADARLLLLHRPAGSAIR